MSGFSMVLETVRHLYSFPILLSWVIKLIFNCDSCEYCSTIHRNAENFKILIHYTFYVTEDVFIQGMHSSLENASFQRLLFLSN